MNPAIGIDVGGTSTRIVTVDGDGRVVFSARTDTASHADDFDRMLAHLCRQAVGHASEPASCGIAMPGILSTDRRRVVRSLNLPFLTAFRADRVLGREVSLLTDAEATTWGTYLSCDPRPANLVQLRLGTGVALGVIRDHALQAIPREGSRHSRSLVIPVDARQGGYSYACPCGGTGCLEIVASGKALADRWFDLSGHTDLAHLAARLVEGDPCAGRLVDHAAEAVASVLVRLVAEFDPRQVVLAGGVTAILTDLANLIVRYCRQSGIEVTLRDDDTAGAKGAADLAARRVIRPVGGRANLETRSS